MTFVTCLGVSVNTKKYKSFILILLTFNIVCTRLVKLLILVLRTCIQMLRFRHSQFSHRCLGLSHCYCSQWAPTWRTNCLFKCFSLSYTATWWHQSMILVIFYYLLLNLNKGLIFCLHVDVYLHYVKMARVGQQVISTSCCTILILHYFWAKKIEEVSQTLA